MAEGGAAVQAADRTAPEAAGAIVAALRDRAELRGRDDLVGRLDRIRSRLDRTDTVVCVVGEFKQGKSALINALLDQDVCPVDDDLATMAVTTVRYGAPARAIVHRRGAPPAGEDVPAGELAGWVTERGNPDNRLAVEQVVVSLPHPYLERGISLIDTPGIGGLNAAHAAATLAFLPVADVLVFATDASAELTRSELDFLASAVDAGPLVLVALTKIDMYPAWRRILDIDERRLREIELPIRPHPISASLRRAGDALADPDLMRDSGIDAFAEAIAVDAAGRARAFAGEGAARETRLVLDELRGPLALERQALERPEAGAAIAAELATAIDRVAALETAGAQWSGRLDDEFAALHVRVAFDYAAAMRRILRDTNEEIERVDPGRVWNELSARTQREVASAVRDAFLAASDGASEIQAAIGRLIADEDAGPAIDDPVAVDAAALWQDGQAFGGSVRSGVLAGFGLLAGATVGVEMLGMLGALLGTAIVGPALLGAALFFGGKEVAGERRRQLTDRRQQARDFVARFVEDVRFEVDGRLDALVAQLQRDMRARFGERIAELGRTRRDAARAIERAMADDAAARSRRLATLVDELAALDDLAGRIAILESSAGRAA